jgi:glutaredoxin
MNPSASTPASAPPAGIRLYWKPGCSSCLRTREFLTRHCIPFESIDAQDNPAALAELRQLGARGLPVIARGDRFTLCQSFGEVLKFLDLPLRLADPLPPEELFSRLDLVLTAAARYTRQLPASELHKVFRNRNRTQGALAFHIFRVVEMGIGAAQGQGMDVEGFNDQPPADWTAEDIAAWGLRIRDQALAWWQVQPDRSLQARVPTYYGEPQLHDMLERMVWHAAQHTRQLMLMLECAGVQPDRPLTADDLRGLPLPDDVWG